METGMGGRRWEVAVGSWEVGGWALHTAYRWRYERHTSLQSPTSSPHFSP
jgi:hypothetical protein